MKKILSIFAVVMVTLFLSPLRICADEEKTWTKVSNAVEFMVALDRGESIKLVSDIDMSTICYTTREKINGQSGAEITGLKETYDSLTEAPYYKIKGITTMELADKIFDYNIHNIVFSECGYKLFCYMYDCTVNEVFVEDCGAQHTYDDKDFGCVITGTAYTCHFSNLCFLNCKLYDEGSATGLVAGVTYGGTVDNCFASSRCEIYGGSGDNMTTGSFVGSAYGTKISNCKSFALVTAYCDHVGGIVGEMADVNQWTSGSCSNCQFYGMVKQIKYSDMSSFLSACEESDTYSLCSEMASAASTAWTIGWLQVSFANQCAISCIEASTTLEYLAGINLIKNTSIVRRLVISGLSYFVTDASTLLDIALAFNCVYFAYSMWAAAYELTRVAISLEDPDEVGGIAGHAENATFTRCANYGMVYTLDAYGGGIVGYAKNSCNIVNCMNNGAVHGGEQTGGIVGYMNGGSLRTNLNVGNVACTNTEHAGIICGQSEDLEWIFNCYSDTLSTLDTAADDAMVVKASQQDLISGKAALFLNEKSIANNDSCPWRQTIGSDFFPTLCATHDTVTVDSINTELSTTLEIGDNWALSSAMVNPYSDISLTADIDCSNSFAFNLSSEFMPFMGRINGNGHTLSNVSFTQTGASYLIPGTEVLGEDTEDVGMLGCTKNATFSNLILKDFSLDLKTNVVNASPFVGKSISCTYDNVNLTGSSTITQSTSDETSYQAYNLGGLVGYSQNDVFRNCSIGPQCNLTHTAYTTDAHPYSELGGIAGYAEGSTFYRCSNRAKISAEGKAVGGIIGGGDAPHIVSCLNAGHIIGPTMTAGIAGSVNDPYISYCVNTGVIDDINNSRQQYRAAILGYSQSYATNICHNLNFGSVNYVSDELLEIFTTDLKQIVYSAFSDSEVGDGNWFYCQYNGEHNDNTGTTIYQQMLSGQWVYEMNKSYFDAGNTDTLFFQKIEKNYFTEFPVPMPEAGTVYSDILCDGTQSYSNIYSSTAEHTSVASGYGTCSTCGNVLSDIPSSIKISDAAGLNNLAIATNKGIDFSNTTVSLTKDIDMKGYSYIPIGKDQDHAYKGTFDGGGHRVKNVDLTYGTDGTGIFGTISANAATTDDDGLVTGGTVIKNVVVDSTCNISVYAAGVAGLIGAISSTSGDEVYFTIRNCGNEANITGGENTGGILGGVYNNNNTAVDIINCYNSGDISGTSVSGAVCGYARVNTAFVNCWNSGSVTGYTSGYPFAYTGEEDRGTNLCKTTNCFDVNTQSGVTTISTDSLNLGAFCQALNEYVERRNTGTSSSYTYWTQDIGVDTHPVFGTSGVTYSRTMTNPWGTIVLPFDVTISSSKPYSLYQLAAIRDSTLYLTEMSGTLAAGTPAIIKMKGSGETYSLSLSAPDNQTYNFSTSNSDAIAGLELTGTYSSSNISSIDGYSLSDGSFVNITSSDSEDVSNSDNFSAYLAGLLPNNAQTLTLSTDALDDYTSTFTIRTATELSSLADIVNSGQDYSGTILSMGNDIDMTGVDDFIPVGKSASYPFKGIFDGQGYRVKNLTLSGASPVGLFGCVAGESTVIRNVIIDSSCSVTSTDGLGASGLIGCVESTSGTNCNVTVQNCGNEATITGPGNVAGIVGGVYTNDNTVLTMTDCYNTGTLTADSESATLCGYARKNYTFTDCYNSGTLTGGEESSHLFRYASGGTKSVSGCYDTAGTQVSLVTADQVASGELCFMLNGNKAEGTWGHTSTDSHPVPSGEGMQHYSRTMANQWGTICLPFAAATSDDYDFYELSAVSGTTLTLSKVATPVAGTPYIIRRSSSATDIDVSAASGTTFADAPATGSSANGLTLTGAFTSTEITSESGYIIANNSFWNIQNIKGENKVYCDPFRAYLAGTLSDGARSLSIGIDEDTATGICETADSNLQLSGKFLIDGKLVIIKNGRQYNTNGQIIK